MVFFRIRYRPIQIARTEGGTDVGAWLVRQIRGRPRSHLKIPHATTPSKIFIDHRAQPCINLRSSPSPPVSNPQDKSPTIRTRTMGLLHCINRALKCLDPAQNEHHLRSLPILFAAPAIALFAADLRSYDIHSDIQHGQNAAQMILDAIALTFHSLIIIWSLVWSWTVPQGHIGLCFVAVIDILLSTALEAIAERTFSMRTSGTACLNFVDSCDGTSINIMSAAAGLSVVTG